VEIWFLAIATVVLMVATIPLSNAAGRLRYRNNNAKLTKALIEELRGGERTLPILAEALGKRGIIGPDPGAVGHIGGVDLNHLGRDAMTSVLHKLVRDGTVVAIPAPDGTPQPQADDATRYRLDIGVTGVSSSRSRGREVE